MDESTDREFREGQVVHIVTERVKIGPGWASDMDHYFGMEARITYIDDIEGWANIDIDDGQFWWGREMFQEYYDHEPIPDDAEVASVVESILGNSSVHKTAI